MNISNVTEFGPNAEDSRKCMPWRAPDGRQDTASLEEALSNLRPCRVLLPFDFSTEATALLRHIVPACLGSGAVLHVLHVIDPTPSSDEGWAESSAELDEIRTQWREPRLRSAIAVEAPYGALVHTHVRVGRVADEMIACAQSLAADMIIQTASAYGNFRDAFKRSAAERVARLASCPTLTIPHTVLMTRASEPFHDIPPASWKTVLVPVDISCPSIESLKLAAAIVRRNGGRINLLHVAGALTEGGERDRCFMNEAKKQMREALGSWLSEFLVRPIAMESHTQTGASLEFTILLEARRLRADLIVLGVKDHSHTGRLRMGSATDGILRHAICPVVSVPERSRRREE